MRTWSTGTAPMIQKIRSECGSGLLFRSWLTHYPALRNWPLWKKSFVTFSICLLTFSVYIGSAIYTASIPGISERFEVSLVVSTLGLSLFV